MSRKPVPLQGGVGFYYALVGLWLLLCWLAKGGAWLFRLGMSHAGSEPEEPSGPPPEYKSRARAAPSFESYSAYCDEVLARVAEPSAVDPWLAGDEDADPPEPRDFRVARDPDGTIMLRVKEPSRYRRKLIPPRSFTQRRRSIEGS